MLRDRFLFLTYLIGILLLTSIYNIQFYLFVMIFLFLISLKDFFKILKKSLISILLFNIIVSISYIFINGFDTKYLMLINLRVLDLTFLTFFILKKINLFNVFSFSKNFSYLLVLSYSQILSFENFLKDFRYAFISRVVKKPSKIDIYNYLSSIILFFLNKSYNNSKEISQAMKSRGFFND
ncbi:hypothetical protein JCM14244_13170 [Venenivibrio stagnispumantis]|uniref:Cobalt/nickel transport system permease protein n=1 Tax=Venenivibrio stagnispumantis TaxID=407998 RepID=A0AA45WL12_9AQUI|nr:hypothetical protein [Venenivibrio stagnispumantis]SMP09167.1 cobalt/nickel transport system permease protein [Venenivibrio stagnispumantis]